MNRIVFFQGEGYYDVFKHWIAELRESLSELQIETSLVDLTKLDTVRDELNQAFDQPALCYVGVNAQGCEFESEPYCAFEKVKTPFIGICVDHPVWHHDRLLQADPYLFYTFIDPIHVEYAHKVYPEGGYSFLPHAASLATRNQDPGTDRQFKLVFLGTYRDPENRREKWNEQPGQFAQIVDECMEIVMQNGSLDYYKILQHLFSKRQISPSTPLFQQMHKVLFEMDLYLRDTLRKKVLKYLDKENISVELFGKGWEDFPNQNHKIHDPVSYEEALELMAQSQCVLDINPNFPLGLHERLLSAMGNGALVITDHQEFFEKDLIPDQTHLSYSYRDLANLPNKLMRILESPDERVAMAKRGQEVVLKRHLWKHRAKSLVELASFLRTIV